MKLIFLSPAKKGLVSFFLVFTCLFSKSQISATSYSIWNSNATCNVTVDFKIFDGATCTNSCTGSGIVLAPGSNYAIPAACLGAGFDIEVVVTSVGSTPVNFGSGAGGGGPWTCYNSGAPAVQFNSGTNICFTTYNVQAFFGWTKIW